MKRLLLYVLVLALQTAAARCQTLSGRARYEDGSAVEFANVALLKAADSSLVTGAVSDSTGAFSMAASGSGPFLIKITALGAGTRYLPVPETGGPVDLGVISMKSESKALKGVSVTSLRPVITQKADRLEINIEGTALASGNSAFAVLSRIPGVFVDPEGNIQLNGRSGVTVMIDGKLTYLSASDLRNLLESMSAEGIRNIEIITNPSAKFDAAGTAGILNINFRKNTRQGMNGSVYTSYGYNFSQHQYSAGAGINYKSGALNAFANLDFAKRAGGREATFTRVFYAPGKTTYFDQQATGNYENIGPPMLRAGADYSINDRHSIGFTGRAVRNTGKQDFLTDTRIGEAPGSADQAIDADNYNENIYTNYTANLHYVYKPDTAGSSLSADLDYVKISNRGDGHFYNRYTSLRTGEELKDHLYVHTPSGFDIYSVRLDYTRPFRKDQTFETGMRVSRVRSDNDFRFYFSNGPLVPDTQRTNHFTYEESIFAGYLNWNGKISSNLTVQAGLRAEQTISRGESLTTGQVTDRSYLGLFPSLFLQQTVSADYSVNYSYSRRLTRPNYGSLNPFRSYRDPYTWTEGNPFLRPSYTHSISIAQTFRKTYNLTLSYQLSKDMMSEIPILDVERATTVYTTGNVNDGHNLDLTAIVPVKLGKRWDLQLTGSLAYTKNSMTFSYGEVVNEQVFYMARAMNTVLLPLDIRAELTLLYRGPEANGLYRMAAMSRVDIGLKRSFLNKQLEVTLNGNDLFRGYRFIWTTDINGNVNDFNQYFRFRNVSASLRYNFSRGQKVDVRRRAAVDELNRT